MHISRRSVLSKSGLVLLGLGSGCARETDYPPGTLVVQNDHSTTHTVSVTVEDGPRAEIEVQPDETVVKEAFIRDAGKHDITVELDTGDVESLQYELERANGTTSGGHVEITITEDQQIEWVVDY